MSRRLAEIDPAECRVERNSGRQMRLSPLERFFRLAVYVTLGFVVIHASQRYKLSLDVVLIPQLVAGYVISVLVHEGGHAAAALLFRFRIGAAAIWPVRVYRDPTGWHVGLLPLKGVKGFVAIIPSGSRNLRLRQFMAVAAGPLASLALALAGWFALGAESAKPKWIQDQIAVLALWSAIVAAGGLLPSRRGTAVSDGARLRTLLRGGTEWRSINAQQMIATAAMGGDRPRDWPSHLIEIAASAEAGSPEARFGQMLRYNWLVDQRRIDEAEEELTGILLEPLSGPELRVWRLQACWFAAFFRRDAATARKWLQTVHKAGPGQRDCNLLMAEAAVNVIEERWDQGAQLAREALQQCDRLVDRGTAQAIRDELLSVQSCADRRLRLKPLTEAAPTPNARTPETP